jgi:hypothetical protein
VNEKIYIHEFIDIIGHNRAKYMHHMTANWSPGAQVDRQQFCFGVWGVVGTTGPWPQVVNIWEEQGWDGLASSLNGELNNPTLQDPKLAKWWAEAAGYRRGGFDRLVVPAPWSRTIDELCAAGVKGDVYAHEIVKVGPGEAGKWLEHIAETAVPLYAEHGWELAGAWETAMIDESECILLWAIPTWAQWGDFEAAERCDSSLRRWRRASYGAVESTHRILLVDSPLSPMHTGRQPSVDDRVDGWEEL